MEHTEMLNSSEYKMLMQYRDALESTFNVRICCPKNDESSPILSGDVVFITLYGCPNDVNKTREFIKRKCSAIENETSHEAVPLVTLSDTESDVEMDVSNSKRKNPKITVKKNAKKKKNIITIDLISSEDEIDFSKEAKNLIKKKADQFIPLRMNHSKKRKTSKTDEKIVNLNKTPDSTHVSSTQLRPIIIDGSNVAREHGMSQNTFSCKGIKLSVDYFIERGHPKVTVFVPKYRRNCTRSYIKTTDLNYLRDLEKTGQIVYTPSRRINGKQITCYDDRFIVELASKTGGVILSNDSFNDLIDESEEFKKTIQERLLMYCFAEDRLMIPKDPLGRYGPSLDQFLSFPP